MAINKWRHVEDDMDGCSIYECLLCYNRWSSRSTPSPAGEEGNEYETKWKYCPCCGTKWDGRVWRDRDDKDEERSRGWWVRKHYTPTHWWVIERKETDWAKWDRPSGHKWKAVYNLPGESTNLPKLLAFLRKLQAEVEYRVGVLEDEDDPNAVANPMYEYRLIKVKEKPAVYSMNLS